MYEIEEIIASTGEDISGYPDEDLDELSWTVEPESGAVKTTDRMVFLYRETGIPATAREYFAATDLEPGEKKRIVLWHGTAHFDAYIEKTVHTVPRTRMIWKPGFAAVLREHYPGWMEFFKKNRAEAGNTPSLRFIRRAEPGHYDVEFEGAPEGEASPEFEIPLKAGDTIDNDTLRAIFRCSAQGTMRRSLRTSSLVLISDHTKLAGEDTWIGKTYHFTGRGHDGDQGGPAVHQNKTLAESAENGVRLWLFEVFSEGQYMFVGEVSLADSPYRSRQPDSEKNLHDVWIFPLKLTGRNHPPLIKKELIETKEETVRKIVQKMPLDELEFQARYALKEGGKRQVVSEVFEHDQLVSEYVKRKAGGTCQLCDGPAPFTGRHGEPYLEIHHIVPRTEGGADTIENTVALCPNCHRRMHELQLPADIAKLRSIAAKRG